MSNKIIHKKLKNGLNIYLYKDNKKHSVTISLMVKYGGFISDFISNGKKYHLNDGMAHLIEHLVFEHNCYGNFSKLFGPMQMSTNALTSNFMTEYYVDTVENEYFALEHLIKGVSNCAFTKEDIEITKPPIYQEIRMRYDEIGRRVLYNQNKNIFLQYSYISGLGTMEDIKNFLYEKVKLCYETFYQPKNEVLFIAGNINENEMLKKIEEIYDNLHIKNIDFEIIKFKEPIKVKNSYEVIKMPTHKDYISICYKIDYSMYKKADKRMLSYYLGLFLVMNFSNISKLYKDLTNKKIIHSSNSFGFDYIDDILIIRIGNFVEDEEAFINKVQDVIENNKDFNEEVFLLKLKQEKMEKLCNDITPFGISRDFKENYDSYDYPDIDKASELNKLNYSDFVKFINSLDFKNYTITKVINEE